MYYLVQYYTEYNFETITWYVDHTRIIVNYFSKEGMKHEYPSRLLKIGDVRVHLLI